MMGLGLGFGLAVGATVAALEAPAVEVAPMVEVAPTVPLAGVETVAVATSDDTPGVTRVDAMAAEPPRMTEAATKSAATDVAACAAFERTNELRAFKSAS